MGEKYLNAIDKPVPGLITHADSGLHIDHAPRFLQTPLWGASGLPPTKLSVWGDLRRPGGGLTLVARGTPETTLGCLPSPSPFPKYSASVPRKGAPGQPLCSPAPGVRARRHRRALIGTQSPAAAASSSRTRRVVTPGAAVSHGALREYKLIKRFPALSQGPESPSQA